MMAPPTRLRPHLNDLLQKNLELEHIVADLRHQLTQSSAKWAEERKMLAVGCDTLMASFAKFRARLDIHASDWGDSEGEVEQNLYTGEQNEEAGEVDHEVQPVEAEGRDQVSASVVDQLRERCHTLAAELQIKEEELEDSRRKHGAAEEELKRVRQSLEVQREQLRTALVSAKADTDNNDLSPERTPEGTPAQPTGSNASTDGLRDALEKLDLANQEIARLRQLLQQWQKYANDWKRDAQSARVRASELQLREQELSVQVKATEENRSLLDAERKGSQRLTSALADQTAEVENQRVVCQESARRIQELEATVALLRAQLSSEQLVSIDPDLTQATTGPSDLAKSPTPHADADTNKRNDMIILKIPYLSAKKLSAENNGPQDGEQNQTLANISISPASQMSNSTPRFNSTDFELCIHTCNPFPCRNESQSFLWPRKQASLPRHAVSAKKHRRCTPDCPGHRLLAMPVGDALKEPRRAKCRLPTEAELALAEGEARKVLPNESAGEKGTEAEEVEREGSGEPDEPEDLEQGSIREGAQEEQERTPQNSDTSLGKRLRSRLTDSEESSRARKLRSRMSATKS